ncbi:putative Actin family, folylpolyglutamate synthetase [Lupinus albus]|uniref:Actin-related protein 6 n=1 Tax=Lupinus albus TaxID=3870 RepID=A0A6A4Q495_LUPAL|nr:putative Actin family, folylpolyglutamate synthetase [Lupinus albus]
MSSPTTVVVLDNGGGLIKAGLGGERDPSTILPNCLYRSPASKKWLHPNPLPTTTTTTPTTEPDLTSAAVRRPIDRGYLINPDLQREIWSHLFSSILRINPSHSSLLLTEPLFTLPSIQRSLDELVFEDFNFNSLYIADSPSLVHLYEASRRPDTLVSRAQCSLVVDCGFSFTHASPVFQNFTLNYAAKRIDLGGKALTNYLKELVSFRAVNVMEETFIMDDVKEKLCFVSLDVPRDLHIARNRGKENLFRSTYVLPDGVTHMKGFVKYPEQARRYLSLADGGLSHPLEEDMNCLEFAQHPEERKTVDLTKNEFDLTNERFLVPEMIFHPADLGMNQAGLAECIVRAVNSCHPHLHPVLYESIILTGGSTLFPQFAARLEKELRPLVPADYNVKITAQEDPILGVWRGGSLLASSPDFEAMCVTKSEYEEHGSARCHKRFFH